MAKKIQRGLFFFCFQPVGLYPPTPHPFFFPLRQVCVFVTNAQKNIDQQSWDLAANGERCALKEGRGAFNIREEAAKYGETDNL